MKTQIKAISDSRVIIKFACLITDDVYEYDIWAPSSGGYVRYNGDHQLCERLGSMGSTLMWSGKEPLVNMIRKEYRRFRAAQFREMGDMAIADYMRPRT
jgi:hypothetical protein